MGPLDPYRLDVCKYAHDLLGLKLHNGQQEVLYTIFPPEVEPRDWPYRECSLSAANRWGKSVKFSVVHLWSGTFKHLLPHEFGSDEWFIQPYPIINLCPVVDLAYVVREKVGEILEGRAKEQIERAGGRGTISPLVVALFNENPQPKGKSRFLHHIPDTEYDGFITAHGSTLEYRTSSDSAKAIQGRKFYIVTYDEYTREKDPVTLVASDIRPRVLDTRGIIIEAGTPHLETESTAEELWLMGDPRNPKKNPKHISFMRDLDDNPAITQEMKDELVLGTPDYLKPQILQGKWVQSEEAFFNSPSIDEAARDIPNLRRRTRGHTYIISWDLAVAKDGDSSIGIVYDVTRLPIVVTEIKELSKGTKQPDIVGEMKDVLEFYNCERFQNTAMMVFDATGMGGRMFRDDIASLRPRPKDFDFAGSADKKLSILKNAKAFFDKRWIVYPREVKRFTYEHKRYRRKDTKLETDTVMANAMCAHWASRLLLPARGTHIITQPLVY